MPKQRRKAARTQLWFDSEAIVKFEYGKIKGKVDNLSAKGMFIETSQHIPEYSEVEIKIIFKSKTPSIPRSKFKTRSEILLSNSESSTMIFVFHILRKAFVVSTPFDTISIK